MVEDTMIPSELDSVNEGIAPYKADRSAENIATLKTHPGWKEIEEYINGQIATIDNFDTTGLDVATIGYYHLASKLVRAHLDAIKMLVDANYDHAIEEERRSGGGGTEGK